MLNMIDALVGNSLEYQKASRDIYMPDGTEVNNYNNSCSTITGAFFFS